MYPRNWNYTFATIFKRLGTIQSWTEALKKWQIGSDFAKAKLRRNQFGISSGPAWLLANIDVWQLAKDFNRQRSANSAVAAIKPWSHRPTQLNSTQLNSTGQLSWVELSFSSDHTARLGVITLKTQLNSTQLKNRQFSLSREVLNISESVELRWVESGGVITRKTQLNQLWPSFHQRTNSSSAAAVRIGRAGKIHLKRKQIYLILAVLSIYLYISDPLYLVCRWVSNIGEHAVINNYNTINI